VQDADQPVGELAEGGMVAGSAAAELIVAGAGVPAMPSTLNACWCRASASQRLRMNRDSTAYFLPGAWVMGLVPK
jgi:hypothetical protein